MDSLYVKACSQLDPDSSIRCFEQLLSLSIAGKNDSLTNGTLLKLGELYVVKGDLAKGLTYTKQALSYTSSLSLLDQANVYGHLGSIYFSIGDYVSATENFYLGLSYIKRSDNMTSGLDACIYRYLGMINIRLHQNEKALHYLDLGEASARRNGSKNLVAILLLCKGEYYTGIHRIDSARKCFDAAVVIADKIARTDLKVEAYEGIGKALIEAANYKEAVHFLQLAIDVGDSIEKSTAIDASYYLGEALYRLRRYNDAERVLVNALEQASAAQLKDNKIKGYTILTEVYKATGQYPKAMECMDSFIVLKESLENAEKTRAINLMDIKYQTAQKDKRIAKSELLIARQNSKIARKNMWMLIIGGSVLLLLVVSGGIYSHSLNRQRSLEKENKIGILQAAVRGGDNERRRIARELHDGIGGMLSAAIMRFSSMHHEYPAITGTRGYSEAMDILREMGDEIRKTAHNLMPEVLLKQSLPDAIRAYCNNVHKSDALHIDLQRYGSFDDVTQDQKLNLYRIVQELIKNIIEHAGASHAMVQLFRNEQALIVIVEDDGCGFDKTFVKMGQGLHNIQTRVHSLDGKLTLESTPGRGTSIFIEIETERSNSDKAA
ncbi:sensor histidine kinase [Nemorincola caseinilytica]|uniref:histidine kinase n=2 Tax=Nemorincola caseinilytica TaxID=2054315 RepID=A0ABP8N8I1_9BACT